MSTGLRQKVVIKSLVTIWIANTIFIFETLTGPEYYHQRDALSPYQTVSIGLRRPYILFSTCMSTRLD